MEVITGMWITLQWLGLRASQALAEAGPEDITPAGSSEGIRIENPLSCDDWAACIESALSGLVILAAPVTAIAVLIGGYQLMASGGSEEKVSRGKKTIIYAAVGYGVILLATAVAGLIEGVLSTGPSGNPPTPPPIP